MKAMPRKKSLAPQQSRSRESLQKLMQAAKEVLQEKGLEGATIPRIAARAGLSPGSVYRRFPDKDALLRKVVLSFVQGIDDRTVLALTPELAKQHKLKFFVELIVRDSLMSYRKYSRMLSSITQFFRAHPSAAFRREVDEIETRSFRRIVRFLLHYRNDIHHPDPEAAVSFSLAVLGFSLREIVLMEVITDVWAPLLPKDDNQLVHEFTSMMLKYMRAEGTCEEALEPSALAGKAREAPLL
jgi:AcrR family transcriptional regulator